MSDIVYLRERIEALRSREITPTDRAWNAALDAVLALPALRERVSLPTVSDEHIETAARGYVGAVETTEPEAVFAAFEAGAGWMRARLTERPTDAGLRRGDA